MQTIRLAALTALITLGTSAAALAQDAAAGEKVFAQCRACHQIGPGAKNLIGPELNGVVGRKAGSVEGYNYSAANKNSGLTWDEATLSFAGIKDDKKIDDVVAYLAQFGADGQKK